MRNITIAAAFVFAMLGAAAPAQAAFVECPGSVGTGDREFGIEPDSGSASCRDYGAGNVTPSGAQAYTSEPGNSGLTFIDESPGGGGLLTWSVSAGCAAGTTCGLFTIAASVWDTWSSIVIVLKSGVGQLDPDWAGFNLTGNVTSGDWRIIPNTAGGLSHVMIFGGTRRVPDTVVPEPASMLLFGTGLLGLARATRNRWSVRRS